MFSFTSQQNYFYDELKLFLRFQLRFIVRIWNQSMPRMTFLVQWRAKCWEQIRDWSVCMCRLQSWLVSCCVFLLDSSLLQVFKWSTVNTKLCTSSKIQCVKVCFNFEVFSKWRQKIKSPHQMIFFNLVTVFWVVDLCCYVSGDFCCFCIKQKMLFSKEKAKKCLILNKYVLLNRRWFLKSFFSVSSKVFIFWNQTMPRITSQPQNWKLQMT